ncbi:hypothetical protein VFPFJ_11421 [Purpureocillium lilacinum]|uniref:Rhodopsin domain-containing protein n=1 Tax=Purpureocillium lilacinum TaxID=33203 RepID=A0A179FAN0_PURLI|nr:hypothetical protein VFPFJ_11421 [Purpureocillium lilacinum]OAQ62524.1 hypothetical protein VFPFJ_11421 [Purpureocillium lilacinum]
MWQAFLVDHSLNATSLLYLAPFHLTWAFPFHLPNCFNVLATIPTRQSNIMLANTVADVSEDRGLTLWACITTFAILSFLAVFGRFSARRLKAAPLANGLGKHRAVVSEAQLSQFYYLLYYFQICYVVAPPTVKLSLLFLYKRIFPSRRFHLVVHTMALLVAMWGITSTFISIFNCTPVSAFWTRKGSCLDFKKFGIGYAIVNITTDFAVWLMPMPSVWSIQLPTSQKIALCLIFLLGLFDCAAALTRLVTSMLVLDEKDVTWFYSTGFMWSVVEVSTSILCTCLPTMRILLQHMWTKRVRPSNSHDASDSRVLSGRHDKAGWPLRLSSGGGISYDRTHSMGHEDCSASNDRCFEVPSSRGSDFELNPVGHV